MNSPSKERFQRALKGLVAAVGAIVLLYFSTMTFVLWMGLAEVEAGLHLTWIWLLVAGPLLTWWALGKDMPARRVATVALVVPQLFISFGAVVILALSTSNWSF